MPEQLKEFLVIRTVPGAHKMPQEDLRAISQRSCSILKNMDNIEWVKSFITPNRITCHYRSANEELIRDHAAKGEFPVDAILEIFTEISPATAQEAKADEDTQ